MLLAGDIGGTKTNLAIFSSQAGLRAPLAEATFPSGKYSCLEDIVQEFIKQVSMPVNQASFGVAGPVNDGHAVITNLPWIIDEQTIRQTLHLSSVSLLNDLEAIAYAVPILEPIDVHTINAGETSPGGGIAVIAPGTGLGEAYLTWDGTRYRAYPSEGGHASFSPNNDDEMGLLQYLRGHFGHVSFERVCSGNGLPNIYAYLRDSQYAEETPEIAAQLAEAADPTPVIVQAALDPDAPCSLCQATLNMFLSILGTEASNLALKILATGGVYLGGGIPPRILSALENGRFLSAFRNKGRFSDLMARIPVRVILNPKTALLGAARYGLDRQS